MVALEGEAYMDTAPVLARVLRRALAGRPLPGVLVVDCSGLTFCACDGLNELLRARREAAELGVAFRLAAPGEQLARLLEITGTGTVLEVLPAASAVSALGVGVDGGV